MTTSMITSNSAMAMAYPSAVACELEYMSGQPTLCHSLQPDTCTPFAPDVTAITVGPALWLFWILPLASPLPDRLDSVDE